MAFAYFNSGRTRLSDVPGSLEAPVLRAVGRLPRRPRSVIVVIEENKDFDDIIGQPNRAPYINALAARGAVFTRSYGVAHPSQPNYLALFAGQTNRNGDNCPAAGIPSDAGNLASQLLAAHHRFRAYAEDLPAPGYLGCVSGQYARKHAPWTDFTNIPATLAVPFTDLRNFDRLPDVVFVIPNQLDDMHSASILRGDTWLRDQLGPLIDWGVAHDALVIVTFDESAGAVGNHIPTIFVGSMVVPGRYDQRISHYSVLRTIEDLFDLPHAGHAADAAPITRVWR